MFLVINLDHERIKIRSRLLLYCSHTLNELSKGNLHQVNEFPRDVSDID